jgi:hypothetical protein
MSTESLLFLDKLEEESRAQQPLYRVTVQFDLNPFLPVSFITRRAWFDAD